MSKYEDYNTTSSNYDNQRVAMGSDVMAAMLQYNTGRPLKDLHVLDAGCGTGNYAKALLDAGAGQVTLMDASSGMLAKARYKVSEEMAAGRIGGIVEGIMPPLPFNSTQFDAVMFNLVLHHLDGHHDGTSYPVIEKTLTDARRVMVKDGILAITTLVASRYMPLLWYKQIHKAITKRHACLYPEVAQWLEILDTCGYNVLQVLHVDYKMPNHIYAVHRDPEGPLKKEWRDCSSYWASATVEEIAEVEEKVQAMKKAGVLEKYVQENDKTNGLYPHTLLFATPKC